MLSRGKKSVRIENQGAWDAGQEASCPAQRRSDLALRNDGAGSRDSDLRLAECAPRHLSHPHLCPSARRVGRDQSVRLSKAVVSGGSLA